MASTVTATMPQDSNHSASASHGRLPSIKNILSPQDETPPRDDHSAANVPRSYVNDIFKPRPKSYQSSTILPPSLAGAPEAYPESSRPVNHSAPTSVATPSTYGPTPPRTAEDKGPRTTPIMGPAAPASATAPPPPSSAAPSDKSLQHRNAESTSPYQMYHTSPASSDYRPPRSAEGSDSSHLVSPSRAGAVVQWVKDVGQCFVFPNGKYIPCTINNEPVNPDFGVTKAGKPRKRLAQACMTCREKKIRCNPGEPKCVQCQKVNRECKRPPPQTSSKDELSSTPTSSAASGVLRIEYKPPPSPASASSVVSAAVPKKRPSSHDLGTAPRDSPPAYIKTQDGEPAALSHAPKRPRPYMDEVPCKNFSPFHNPASGAYRQQQQQQQQQQPLPPPVPSLPHQHMPGSLETEPVHIDPFDKDPHTAMEFLDLYFEHRGRGPYTVFPRTTFMQWAVHCKTKSSDDIMLLYVVMAVGSRFTNTRLKRNIGQRYAQKAAALERERFGELSLQLAQTRLYFLLYYFAEGKNALGWEYLSSGLSACNALNLNTEQGILSLPSDPSRYEYGMNREQLIDCRRRTFFAGYCMDRFIGHNSGHMALLNDDDLFVRLPGPESSFNAGQPVATQTPMFSEGQVCEAFASAPGEMALLVPIVAIWGDVVAHAYRAFHRPMKRHYLERYQQYCQSVYERISEWESMLPDYLRFSPANTAAAASRGCLSPYFIYHAIRFVALIKLNRNADPHIMPPNVVQEHITQAMIEADRLLSIVGDVCRTISSGSGVSADVENTLSQPFPGYAVMAACDVVSSGGSKHDCARVKRQLVDAKLLLERIGRYWYAATKQHDKVERRLFKLGAMDLEACSTGIEVDVWRLPADDFCDSFPEHYDLIHGSADGIFYDAVRRFQ